MLNPVKESVRIVSDLVQTTENEEDRDWDDRGTIARFVAWARYRKSLVAAGVFALVALLFWLYPVLPSAHRNYWTLGTGVYAVSVAYAHIRGRESGFHALQQYDLNILYTGRSVVPRLGRVTGDVDDRLLGMHVATDVDYGGLSTTWEQFRDRFSRREIQNHAEKYHRVEDDGSGRVVRGVLKATTQRADTCQHDIDLFNTISVTHAGEERDEMDSKEVDTRLDLPPVVDERVTTDLRRAFIGESDARKLKEQELQQLRNQLERLEEYVDPAGQRVFEEVKGLYREINRENRRPSRDDEDDSGIDPTNPPENNDLGNGGEF